MDELVAIEFDLAMASHEAIELFLEQAEDDSFYMDILTECRTRPDALKIIMDHPKTPEDIRVLAAKALGLEAPQPRVHAAHAKPPVSEEEKRQSLVKQISMLSISQRIRLAQKGGSQARNVLKTDSNKLVIMAVLHNPKITDSEIESMARNRSILEDALRVIGKSKEWMKNYSVKLALVTNPKTPIGISMPFVATLKKKDLEQLEKNKNVPEGVRSVAKKMIKGVKD